MKITDMWKNMKRFYKMVHQDHPTALFYTVLCGITKATIPFISLYYSSRILDSLLAYNTDQAIHQILILLISVFILGCVHRAAFQAMSVIADASYYSVLKQTTHKAYIMEYEEFEKTETMDKIRRAQSGSNGSGGVETQIQHTYLFISYVVSTVYSLIITVLLFIQSIQASRSVLPSLLLIFAFILLIAIGMYIQNKLARLEIETNHENEHGNSLSSYIISSALNVQNGKDIRLFKMQKLILGWYSYLSRMIYRVFSKYAYRNGLYNGIIAAAMQLFSGCVYIYVGYGVLKGAVSIGNVLLYTGAITRMASDFSSLVEAYNSISYRFEYLGNYEAFIHSKNMHYDGTLPIEKREDNCYEFEFRNVSFKYPNTENYILKNISLKLNVNRRLAIVGQNGAGKTTLIKLLCRLYEPNEGEILLNGINIEKYDYAEYTDIFSVVFQDFKLFPLPLDENIACQSEVDEDKCLQVLEKVGIKDKVMKWPQKQHTRLYKDLGDGINVSGGEAQKIAIARALYKDAPFVILDEPTAALDPISEAEIYENFNEMIQDKTALFISHRMSSCKFCDEIIVFENGEITQKGTHEQLVNQDGLYRELWNAQAQYYA